MKQLAKTLFILCRTAPLLNRFGASCFPHTNDPDFLVMDCLNFDVTDGNFKEAVGGLWNSVVYVEKEGELQHVEWNICRESQVNRWFDRREIASSTKVEKSISWNLPPVGWFKLNTTVAARSNLELAGAGGLERDSNGALSVNKNILCANKQLLQNYEQSKRLRNDLGTSKQKTGLEA